MTTSDYKLVVSEAFYSIQGEGVTIGVPAVFLRLTGCNLTCPGWATDDNPTGCDTTEVWKKGKGIALDDLFKQWEDNGFIDAFNKGAHLVITGGEPFLQQQSVYELCYHLKEKYCPDIFIEIETNGTIEPLPPLLELLGCANVSVKLSNSGNVYEDRYIADAVEAFARFPKSFFKFVVSDTTDLAEIDKLRLKHKIEKDKILLMPMGSSKNDLSRSIPAVVDLCKEHGYRFSPREHIMIWDRKVGV